MSDSPKLPITDDSIEDRPMNLSNVKAHLKKTEKMYRAPTELSKVDLQLVKLAFREGTLRGFNIKELPDYIRIKCDINVSTAFIYNLRRMQLLEDRYWYLSFAKDQYAYVSAYRECIDKIDSIENGLWRIFMNPDVEDSVKVNATKEIHSLVKTRVLLLRDLPFIMNLSKYYDPSKMKDSQGNSLIKTTASYRNMDYRNGSLTNMNYNIDSVSLTDLSNANIVDGVLDKYSDGTRRKDNVNYSMDDEIMEEMENQTKDIKDDIKIREDYEKSKEIYDIFKDSET